MHQKIIISPVCMIFITAIIAFFPTNSWSDDAPNCSGYVISRDGKTTSFTRLTVKEAGFKYGPEDKKTEIPFADLREMKFGEGGKSALITMKDGRKLTVKPFSNANWSVNPHRPDSFWFLYFDDFAKKEEKNDIVFTDIAEIHFNEQVGRYRVCPHCHSVWSDSFLFCPLDGQKTTWGEPSGSATSSTMPNLSDQEKKKIHARLIEAALNANLARAGIDPKSSDAEWAKDFSLLWINPLTKQKEIDDKLSELRHRLQ